MPTNFERSAKFLHGNKANRYEPSHDIDAKFIRQYDELWHLTKASRATIHGPPGRVPSLDNPLDFLPNRN